MSNHFILRIGDGKHFNASSLKYIWGINSKIPYVRGFINKVKAGDILWFVIGGAKGKIVAVATFKETKKRDIGPLINFTFTNSELGWGQGDWDTEVIYTNLYNLTHLELLSEISSPLSIRSYNDKCKVNLILEYPLIVRYSKVTNSM